MSAFGEDVRSDGSNRQPQSHSDRAFHGRLGNCRGCPTHAESCYRTNRYRYA
jgi:hypothetical protein